MVLCYYLTPGTGIKEIQVYTVTEKVMIPLLMETLDECSIASTVES